MLDESRTPAPGRGAQPALSIPDACCQRSGAAPRDGFGAPRGPDPPRVVQRGGWGADPARRLPGAAPKCLKHWRQEELPLPANSCPVLLR